MQMAYLGQPEQEDDVYSGDIPEEVDMESDFDSAADAEAAAAESKAKERLQEIEQEAGALREMQAKVESQIGVAQGTAGADNISAPTGDDKMDKSILPKVMQVKHFGRSGSTKWIRLVNEDTTDWDSPWTCNDPLRAKYNQKMAGMNTPVMKRIFARGKGKGGILDV